VSIGLLTLQKAFNAEPDSREQIVLIALGALSLASFLCSLSSVRYLNTAGYLTLVSDAPLGPEILRHEEHHELERAREPSIPDQKDIELANVPIASEKEHDKLNSLKDEMESLIFEGFEWKSSELQKFHLRKIKMFLRCMDMITVYTYLAIRLLMYCIAVGFCYVSPIAFLVASILLVIYLVFNDNYGVRS
jgi:hypothetical protein